jgi:hypothetical protein
LSIATVFPKGAADLRLPLRIVGFLSCEVFAERRVFCKALQIIGVTFKLFRAKSNAIEEMRAFRKF